MQPKRNRYRVSACVSLSVPEVCYTVGYATKEDAMHLLRLEAILRQQQARKWYDLARAAAAQGDTHTALIAQRNAASYAKRAQQAMHCLSIDWAKANISTKLAAQHAAAQDLHWINQELGPRYVQYIDRLCSVAAMACITR